MQVIEPQGLSQVCFLLRKQTLPWNSQHGRRS